MKKLFFLPFFLLSLFLSACGLATLTGSGKIVSSSRPVSGFSELVFDFPGELVITQGEQESLRIEGDDNLLDEIKTEVIGQSLHIYTEPTLWLEPTQPIRFTLSVKTLKQIALNGSGTISATNLKSNQLAVRLNGSGKIVFGKLNATSLDFDMSGSGGVSADALSADELRAGLQGSGEYQLKGKINHQDVNVIGSGKYDARSLESTKAEISVNGSGDAMAWVTEIIRVSIVGSGSVGYMGNPKVVPSIAGSGSVYQLQ